MRSRVAIVWLLCGVAGCGTSGRAPQAPARPHQGAEIVVGTVGEDAEEAAHWLEAIGAHLGEWEATRKARATRRAEPIEPRQVAGIDVLIFRADRLGDLVDARALAVLPELVVRPAPAPASEGDTAPVPEPDPLAFADVVPSYRDEVTKYGDDRLALPLGGTALVLVYRRDAFDREENRAAARAAGLTLGPPSTWEQFDALAQFFDGRDWDGDRQPDAGLALAWGPDDEGTGNAIFLSRAAALGLRRDQYSFLFDAETLQPRIDLPPFAEALRALVALSRFGPEGAAGFDAEAAREAFRSGRVALLIDRAERASSWTDPERPSRVGVAALPGSDRVYDPERQAWESITPPNRPTYLPQGGGWLVGLATASIGARRAAALDFLRYAASPEVTAGLRLDRALPLLPVRSAAIGQGLPDPRSSPGVDGASWSKAVGETLNAERVVPGLRIPQAEGYLAELGQARRQAVLRGGGTGAIVEVLRGVARAWSARSQALDHDRQRWHYRRSLNKVPTPPTPPPRPGAS